MLRHNNTQPCTRSPFNIHKLCMYDIRSRLCTIYFAFCSHIPIDERVVRAGLILSLHCLYFVNCIPRHGVAFITTLYIHTSNRSMGHQICTVYRSHSTNLATKPISIHAKCISINKSIPSLWREREN